MLDFSQKNLDRPIRVIMLGYGGRPGVLEGAEVLRAMLPDWVELVESDFSGEKNVSSIEADLAIVLGGDGSILHAVHQMGYRQLPVIAVNVGWLGFWQTHGLKKSLRYLTSVVMVESKFSNHSCSSVRFFAMGK